MPDATIEPSEVYETTYALAAVHGPDVAIETLAVGFEILCGKEWGLGEVLREAWQAVKSSILQGHAALSENELEPHHREPDSKYYVLGSDGAAEAWR